MSGKLIKSYKNIEDIIVDLNKGKFIYMVAAFITLTVFVNCCCGCVFIFTSRDVNYRCRINECDSDNATFNESWNLHAIPYEAGAPSKCWRYDRTNLSITGTNNTCDEENFNRNNKIPCTKWIFEDKGPIVTEFNVLCEPWKLALVGTMNGMGQVIGAITGGLLSDKYGRMKFITYSIFLYGICGIIQSYSIDYWTFLFLEWLGITIGGGAYCAAFVLGVEYLSLRNRIIGSTFLSGLSGVSIAIFAAYAWAIPYWRDLLRVTYVQSLFIFGGLWFIPESFRWLVSQGRNEEAKNVIKKGFSMNKIEISDETWAQIDVLLRHKDSERRQNKNDSEIKNVFKSKKMLLRIAVCSCTWFLVIFVYNGLLINATLLGGNMYINFAMVSFMDVPGQLCYYFVLNWLGRRKSQYLSMCFCGITCLAYTYVHEKHRILALMLYLFAKYCSSLTYSIVYIQTSELFPTSVRHFCLGFCILIGRFGMMLAPQCILLQYYNKHLPMITFSIASFLCSISAYLSEETKNKILRDTIEEEEEEGIHEIMIEKSTKDDKK